jgi:hypothetical protein
VLLGLGLKRDSGRPDDGGDGTDGTDGTDPTNCFPPDGSVSIDNNRENGDNGDNGDGGDSVDARRPASFSGERDSAAEGLERRKGRVVETKLAKPSPSLAVVESREPDAKNMTLPNGSRVRPPSSASSASEKDESRLLSVEEVDLYKRLRTRMRPEEARAEVQRIRREGGYGG